MPAQGSIRGFYNLHHIKAEILFTLSNGLSHFLSCLHVNTFLLLYWPAITEACGPERRLLVYLYLWSAAGVSFTLYSRIRWMRRTRSSEQSCNQRILQLQAYNHRRWPRIEPGGAAAMGEDSTGKEKPGTHYNQTQLCGCLAGRARRARW